MKKSTAEKTAAQAAASNATRRATAGDGATGTAAGRKTARKASTGATRTAGTGKSRSTAKSTGNGKPSAHKITPEEALSNTRALLADKQARDRERGSGKDRLYGASASVPHAGFQSAEARDKAAELHEGEMNLGAIESDVAGRDRRQQGKRDNR